MTGRTNAQSGGGGARTFTGTYTLGHLTASSAPAAFADGGSFSTTLTPSADFELPGEVTLTMAGVTLTAGTHYTYSSSTGALALTIPVRGDLTLTAAATLTVNLYGPDQDFPYYAVLRNYNGSAHSYYAVWLAEAGTTPWYNASYTNNSIMGTYWTYYTGVTCVGGCYRSDAFPSVDAAIEALRSASTQYTFRAASNDQYGMNSISMKNYASFGEQIYRSSLTLCEYLQNQARTEKAPVPIEDAHIIFLS